MSEKLQRKYGLFTAICMVAGIVIGSGVFFKAQTILQKTNGDMPLGIIAWIIGGAIMLVCLLTFSKMGQKYERVNGLVDYAEATVGPKYGYLFGWFMAVVYYPAMTAALAWLSARYTLEFITCISPDFPLSIPASEGGCMIGPECMVLSFVYLCMSYTINTLSPKLAGKFQTTTTVIKLIPLGLMAVVGVIYGAANGTLMLNFNATNIGSPESGNLLFTAVCATAFAYEGWIIATSINAELHNSKKNLPKALTIGGIIIIAVYIFYYIGVAGAASTEELVENGTTIAFQNVLGGLGNILLLFVAVSCLGTLNGLMLATSRGMYCVAARGNGPASETMAQIDRKTNMPSNSAIIGLLVTSVWFMYFYAAKLACLWDGAFVFDPTELPIITIYAMYIPIFIMWIKNEKDQNLVSRYILPILAMLGSCFMIIACIVSHGIGCVWYFIVFAIVIAIGLLTYQKRK